MFVSCLLNGNLQWIYGITEWISRKAGQYDLLPHSYHLLMIVHNSLWYKSKLTSFLFFVKLKFYHFQHFWKKWDNCTYPNYHSKKLICILQYKVIDLILRIFFDLLTLWLWPTYYDLHTSLPFQQDGRYDMQTMIEYSAKKALTVIPFDSYEGAIRSVEKDMRVKFCWYPASLYINPFTSEDNAWSDTGKYLK